MHLVTVTCNKDLNDMLLQAESIRKFLEPCTHWVIVNDYSIDKKQWIESLQPYYTKHKLKILFPNYWATTLDGYAKQNLYKLLISNLLDDDYIILDSKNFFIKKCNTELDEINHFISSIGLENKKTKRKIKKENWAIKACIIVNSLIPRRQQDPIQKCRIIQGKFS